MAADKKPQEQRAEVDERWIDQWLTFGFTELDLYLWKRAEFDKWCASHDRNEQEDARADQP